MGEKRHEKDGEMKEEKLDNHIYSRLFLPDSAECEYLGASP